MKEEEHICLLAWTDWLLLVWLVGIMYLCVVQDLKMGRGSFLLYAWHFPEYTKPGLVCPFYAYQCLYLVADQKDRVGFCLRGSLLLNLGSLTLLPHSRWASFSAPLEVAYKPGTGSAHFFSFKVTLACFKWSLAIGEGQPFRDYFE